MQDNPNPEWEEVFITSGKLCNGDWNRQLKFEIFDHDMVLQREITLDDFKRGLRKQAAA